MIVFADKPHLLHISKAPDYSKLEEAGIQLCMTHFPPSSFQHQQEETRAGNGIA